MSATKKGGKTTGKASKEAFFAGREYYYLHNEGSDKRVILSSQEDFDRFEAYLYLLNAIESPRAANLFVGGRQKEIFTTARGEKLVAIGVFALVPHGFHILATPLVDGGIGKFMQKVQTAYTMYFNAKYGRTGRLFHSAYRAEELDTEEKLKRMYAYIHLHPASIFDARWEDAQGTELARFAVRAMEYRYSSAGEYAREHFVITDPKEFPAFMRRTKDVQAHYALWMKYKGA